MLLDSEKYTGCTVNGRASIYVTKYRSNKFYWHLKFFIKVIVIETV